MKAMSRLGTLFTSTFNTAYLSTTVLTLVQCTDFVTSALTNFHYH